MMAPVPGEAMRVVAELISFGHEYFFFRGSAETDSGNKVDVWKTYPEHGGTSEEYRWRVWASLKEDEEEKSVLAKGIVVSGTDSFLAITKACHELDKVSRRIVAMEEELKRLSSLEAYKSDAITHLDFGRIL